MKKFERSIIEILTKNGICVIPTDTIYGIVGKAENKATVERIYAVRGRNPQKPCIILIASINDLTRFGITLSASEKAFIETHTLWPGKVSIILPVLDPQFTYLTRGTKSLAFRMPNDEAMQALITETGPLIAPSANKEGFPPARNIAEAKTVFGDLVDAYVDGGELNGEASTIIHMFDGRITLVREGAVHMPSLS